MGNWVLVIHGHGQHDNNQAADIEHLAPIAVKELEKHGQTVNGVMLTIGSTREKHEPTEADPREWIHHN